MFEIVKSVVFFSPSLSTSCSMLRINEDIYGLYIGVPEPDFGG